MSDDDVIQAFRLYYEGLFPRTCPKCGHSFETLRDYILTTQRVGPSLSYDVELGDYKPRVPIGGLAMANCVCGSTLALTTETMPLAQQHLMLEWVRVETQRRGMTANQLLDHVRDEVRKQVCA